MSKIDELIAEHCSNGIEFQDLNKVATIKRGVRVTKKDLLEDGAHPVVSGGIGYMGYINEYNREAETITIAQYGTAGFVKWQTRKFWANDVCFSVIPNLKVIDNKYLYYFLADKQEYLYGISNRNAVPYSIDKEKILKIKIPLPPLEVQREVVKVLDTFTQLEAELSAELSARRKQYEYYRNQLLSFGELTERERERVRWTTLGEMCNIMRGKRLVKKELEADGKYPVYQNSMTPLGYYEQSNYSADTTFIISAGAAGEIGYSYTNFWAADDVYIIQTPDSLMSRFLYHALLNQKQLLASKVRRASIPRLSRTSIEKLNIPIPSLAEQERIVGILDKFDRLTTDISEGIPAEISARHKQYGYYRNKLLKLMELQSV